MTMYVHHWNISQPAKLAMESEQEKPSMSTRLVLSSSDQRIGGTFTTIV